MSKASRRSLVLCLLACLGACLLPAQTVWQGRRDSGLVSLTLDDGYNADPRILGFLEEHAVRGTAFLNGEVVERHPELALRLFGLGWEICPHTYNHVNVATLSKTELEQNLRANRDIIFQTVGVYPRWFRPPYGISTAASEQVAAALGMRSVLFSTELSTADFVDGLSLEKKLERMASVLERVRPGDIILAHFGARDSYELIRYTVTTLLSRGFAFGTVSDILNPARQSRTQTSGDIKPN